MTHAIDLNADLGEDESAEGITRDLNIMHVISSCNIACGGHAGSAETMRRMLLATKEENVSAGAHPSYPDRKNFGRKAMDISKDALLASLNTQINDIQREAESLGRALSHLKPHGALYNDAQDDAQLADLIISICLREQLALVGMAGSKLHLMAKKSDLPFIAEAFIDRRYNDNGRLVPRSETGAMISNNDDRLAQGLALAKGDPIKTQSGRALQIPAQTLCLHSDSDGALASARSIRAALDQSAICVKAINA